MIGNKIAQRVQSDRNLPLASALSAALLVGVSLLMIGAWWWRNRDQEPKEANP
jgi:ABC-type spermidine/putrescine transport system permease subunit I